MANDESTYHLKGLSCANCAMKIEKSLKSMEFSNVELNFTRNTLTIDSNNISELNKILSKIEPGVKVLPLKHQQEDDRHSYRNTLIVIGLSITLLFLGISIENGSFNYQ